MALSLAQRWPARTASSKSPKPLRRLREYRDALTLSSRNGSAWNTRSVGQLGPASGDHGGAAKGLDPSVEGLQTAGPLDQLLD
jgi:hypothetical protein